MVDAATRRRRVISGQAPHLRKDLYLAACEAKGATRQEDRASLFDMPRRSLLRYELDQLTDPRVVVMRHIARTLDLEIDDLWPAA